MSNEKKYKKILIHIVDSIMNKLATRDVKNIDGNYFHFTVYNVIQKIPDFKKNIPAGWYVHGPYIPWLDDVLVENFKMDKKYHQLKGEEPYMTEFCKTKYLKILHLHVKGKYWKQVKDGEKTEEFREIKPFWNNKLEQEYDLVYYYLAYPKKGDENKILKFKWIKPYKKTITHELFGENKEVWVIPLYKKEVLQNENIKIQTYLQGTTL